MSTKILRSKSVPAEAPNASVSSTKTPSLSDVATTLLPGLQQAASIIEVATRVLRHFATEPPPTSPAARALQAAKARQLLAACGHPVERH